MEPLIAVHGLQKRFKNLTAVAGLDLQVQPGEIYGLVGPDGAGKTTIMRLLCAALRPTAGTVHIAGYDMLRLPELGRQRLGYLPQRFALYEDMTVLENIRFFAEVRGLKPHEWRPRCQGILEFVGLAGFTERRAGQLSGGMKQKLGLAVALVHRPQVLLLDEPTTGVDPVTRQDFWQLIIRLISPAAGAERVAVLVSTPYMDEAARCHRVGFLRQGELLVEGAPEALRQRLHGRIIEWVGQPLGTLLQLAEADPGVEHAHKFGDRLHLRTRPGQAAAVLERLKQAAAQHNLNGQHLYQTPATLEDVFMELLES